MTDATGLDDRMRDGIAQVGNAEVLVGIPSYNNAGTIGHVVRSVAEGLRAHFPGTRAVIVNADGGSRDGTADRVREAAGGTPVIAGAYVGLPGKGSAFRAIFETASALGARQCAVVDSDLRSITPEWVARLAAPVRDGTADYVTPLYARHKHDGTITNTIAYPLTRALYGTSVRQPIGGEFGFSGELARVFADGGALGSRDVWDGDVARFGIDIYMTTTAITGGRRVAQAFLGAKIHDPKDPGADLAPMFVQVVGTLFRIAARNVDRWDAARGSTPAPVAGDVVPVDPEPVNASVPLLVENFRAGAAEHTQTWRDALSDGSREAIDAAVRGSGVPSAIAGDIWARIVYDMLAASIERPQATDTIVRSMVPLYFARVAALIEGVAEQTTAEAEGEIESQALSFETAKDHLRRRVGR